MTKLKPFLEKTKQSVQSYLNQNFVIGCILVNNAEYIFSWNKKLVSLWKWHFTDFWNFWSDDVEIAFPGKTNQNLVIGSILENGFEATFMSKSNILNLWICCYFLSSKVETISGKVRQSVQRCLNQDLVIGRTFKICFEATFRSKTNILNLWNEHFSVSWKFWIDGVETILRKSSEKASKPL